MIGKWSGVFVHQATVLRAGTWHNAWQWAEVADEECPGLVYTCFIPAVEYTLQPGDVLRLKSTSSQSAIGSNIAVSINGSPFIPYD